MKNQDKISFTINQISINNCYGSVNEKAIKAVRYLQEVHEALSQVAVIKNEVVVCLNSHCDNGIVDKVYGENIYCDLCRDGQTVL